MAYDGITTPQPRTKYVTPPITVVGTTSGLLIPAGVFVQSVVIQTLPGSVGNVYLSLTGKPAVVGQGAIIPANGGAAIINNGQFGIPVDDVYAITDAALAQTVAIFGG